ncbi:PAS-domain containing protein [Lichenihabitans sp. Uapishka_5]|uniref:PAS-domain containing protein n=1 Tax=Lichenihabitans sp. Uapishka_5 TaxID=3037302 RepID=UPI0029E7E548|nr:PAS-domain containing protein [Lichenihabitans sp. Uapishka_5]MDX7953567.1 PAS-domain containing protein [Lichenihabitans sp. Uapishka_5]
MGSGWRSLHRPCGGRRTRWALLAGACTVDVAGAAEPHSVSADIMAQHGAFASAALVSGLVLFATTTALLSLFARRRWADREQGLLTALSDVRAKLDRAQVFLAAEPQIVVAWSSAQAEPEIEGDLSLVTDLPMPRRILGFGAWLPPESAQALDHAVDRLRARGEAFRMAIRTKTGRHMEAEGRAMGGRAILRLRDVSGDRLELTRLREQHGRVVGDLETMRHLADNVPDPVWSRDAAGEIAWVNAAYVRAVEAVGRDEAIARGAELLEETARAAALASRRDGLAWRARAPAVVAGARHMLNVVEVSGPFGSAGMAVDLSELEAARDAVAHQASAHGQLLDNLTTGVAIFDRNKRLQFHNAAYRAIWSLSPAFLETQPFDGEILDRLRTEGRLPEQADFRVWKAGVLAVYRSVETTEQTWYLPANRRLRVVTIPNPDGGVIYLFDDTTERYQLESKFNGLIRVQGETLDTLREGVAVFGTDGRLALFNPAFGEIWHLDQALLCNRPHIDEVTRRCRDLCQEPDDMGHLRSVVAGLADERLTFERRLHRTDGTVVDCAVAPLPDGATLITFTDATDAVNIARVLREQNQVLLDAEQLRNDFVHHVSYELRSPLTNIIGFVELLGDSSVGELNTKQREYSGYILKSSAALLAIINDILDLATIDMDAMELSPSTIDVAATMAEAAKGVQDRLADNGVALDIVSRDDIGSFQADGKRVRQILFNLLSNAIGFSTAGQRVTLAAMRRDDQMVFKVTDEGRGIPLDLLDQVFDRFHSDTAGTRHRGVGLGLSMVRSLMELHGGEVLIDSAPGEGTSVTCIFPARTVATLVLPPPQDAKNLPM